ncbi:DUF6339 family protein [Mesorhizobium sp.]|uniref:DUF6339 family protein n=1 Tax=Mesorhizobium sp. TaxID=1871066 RepID=UPI000FE5AE58|nr:DUF6339 family protein [Mesorhizobium sp.]RWO60519.1 MAG: hypothetical protein EOS14_13540 [Mesorhizobium sp.]
MKARYLKLNTLEDLRNNISDNLEAYRIGNFAFLESDPALSFEHEVEIDSEILARLHAPSGGQYFEAENCATLYAALKELSPYEARDERFWVYLSHTALLAHGRARWPIPADDREAARHISKHFFARDKRQIERDNVGSRLWWMAHLCARIDSLDQKEALEAFLYRSDVRANLIERPTTSQAIALFGALLGKLVLSYKGERALFERSTFRRLMMEVNSVGGYKLLDCLSADNVDVIVNGIILSKLELSKL